MILIPVVIAETANPYSDYFMTRMKNDPFDEYVFPIPGFDEGWNWRDVAKPSDDKKTAIIPPNTAAAKSASIKQTFQEMPTDIEWTHLNVECNSPYNQSGMDKSKCYIDMVLYNDNESTYNFLYPHTQLGEVLEEEFPQKVRAKNSYNLYLENNSPNEIHFSVPRVSLKRYIYTKRETIVSSDHGIKKVTVNIKKGENILIQSMKLKNQYQVDPYIRDLNGYSGLPIIANGTHIIGIDILDQRFLSLWSASGDNLFSMNLYARQDFNISLYYIEAKTNNFMEALEIWHSTFPEVYNIQRYGTGNWVPFKDHKINTTGLTTDFMGKFFWGSASSYMPKDLLHFYYIEATLLHMKGINYIADPIQMEAEIQKCADDPNHDSQKECQVCLECCYRGTDGHLSSVEEEVEEWNVGIKSRVQVIGAAYDYFFGSLVEFNETSLYKGIALDSFTAFNKGYSSPFPEHPFELIDTDGSAFLPAPVGLFSAIVKSGSKSNMANTNAILPQFSALIDCIGYEVKIAPEGEISFNDYSNNQWQRLRYNMGSKAISFLENTYRDKSFIAAEGYFSLCMAFGAYPSYFSHNAATWNFWNNQTDQEKIREQFQRWSPYFNTVLNGSTYYANLRNFAQTNNTKRSSMFCRDKNGQKRCYLTALIDDVSKEATIEILEPTMTSKKVLFKADGINCIQEGNTFRVSSLKPYRTIVIEMAEPGSSNENGKDKVPIAAIVVPIVLVVLILIGVGGFFIYSWIKKGNEVGIENKSIDLQV